MIRRRSFSSEVSWTVPIIGIVLASLSAAAMATTWPTSEELAAMETAGVLGERMQRMNRFETYRFGAGLGRKAIYKMTLAKLEAAGLSPREAAAALFRGPARAFPFVAHPELRSTGTVRTLTVLVDFQDFKASAVLPGMTAESIRQNIHGPGTQAAQSFMPYESLREYYRRASQGKLDIDGEVIGWVRLSKPRSKYKPRYPPGATYDQKLRMDNQALFDLISEAIDQVDAQTDLSTFDNDHDGDVDLLSILYTGPDEGWNSFWWAYRWEFFVPDSFRKTFDGKRLKQFVFQFVDPRQGSDFDPTTLIHETGHALGLPDFYDYCPIESFQQDHCPEWATQPGPDGGIGGLDMMDANWGNHNAFSRWLLDWIDPVVISPGASSSLVLSASGATSGGTKAVAIFPGLEATDTPAQEMFIMENRERVGNDAGYAQMPADGLLIWHVDAVPNSSGDDFEYDNSYANHKLIRLVRANTADDFKNSEYASALDYYVPGKEFSPTSTPASMAHDGRPTGVFVNDIEMNSDSMTAEIGFVREEHLAEAAAAAANHEVSDFESVSAGFWRALANPATEVTDPSVVDRFNDDFQRARPEDLARLWSGLAPRVGRERGLPSVLLELLVTHWAAKDGRAAVDALLELSSESEYVREVFPMAMESWAHNDPKGANDWYLDPERMVLRADPALVAGERFAKTIFRWRRMSEEATAASAIDQLEEESEIYGAIFGLRSATASRSDGKAVDTLLEKLTVKKDVARALATIQVALEEASRELHKAGQSIRSNDFLQEKLRDAIERDRE